MHEEHQIWSWLSPLSRVHLRTIFFNTYHRLNRWVWTQLILGLYHGMAFVIGLLLLQVPFALTIGLLGGLLSLIPYLGVIMATLLAALSVLPTAPWLALWVTLFMTAVTIVGGHVITPVLYGRAVGLNSLIVLIALFVGAQLQGILGMIFAIPVAVIIDTVLQELTFAPQSAAPALPIAAPHSSALEPSNSYEQ
ncbi:MAG: AI-2E family transporter [Caldilineaceae bacterium]